MNIQDYDFHEYQKKFNEMARRIVSESAEDFDPQNVSEQIDEAQVTYNKIQKILNCPEMIKSHAYLYALDMENVDECDRVKIDKLYDLGKARGVIQDDPPPAPENGEEGAEGCDDDGAVAGICGGPDDALTGQEMVPAAPRAPETGGAFVVLYSAMKDGQVKTGEFYSNETNSDDATRDCSQNLATLGYSSIRVLGVEKTDRSVATPIDSVTEDDSKEFEDQETGAGDTAEKPEEKTSDGNEEKPEEAPDEKPEEKPEEPKEKPEEKPEEPKDSPEDNPEEKPEDEPKEENPETAEKADEPAPDEKKLTPAEKQVLKDEYVGMFKAELQRTKLEKSVEDMTIKEKADFWGAIAKKWTKADPEEFMSDKEIEKLNKTVVKN